MKINIGTARIRGLTKPFYYFEHRCCYAWDITFKETSTLLFNNLAFIPVGKTEKEAAFKQHQYLEKFEQANIHDRDRIVVIFDDEGTVIAIGKPGNNVWLDVSDGFITKTFEELKIAVTELKVY